MPSRRIRVPLSDPEMVEGLRRIRDELEVPAAFAPAVVAATDAAIGAPRDLGARVDLRDVEFVTIDPAGSRDLDQAYFAERRPGGTRVRYAIADVSSFVMPSDAVDQEAHQRGATVYLPDGRAPLYPDGLGEGAASLLPDQVRPAVVWTIDLDADGHEVSWQLERATVRSRAALTYTAVQRDLDAGTASPPLALLREIGLLREEQERARGGVSLPLPDQEVRERRDGYELAYDAARPVEGWNAQISLLAGICAAKTMVDGGVGILRTLPPADPRSMERLRRVAGALGIEWPADRSYPDVVHGLDPKVATHAAFLEQAVTTLRGAGYSVLDASTTIGNAPLHSALATPYAHVTAPLRRLADRFANEVLIDLFASRTPTAELVGALVPLPDIMREASRKVSAVDRAVVDLAEALVLRGREGSEFAAVVVDLDDREASVLLRNPAVIATIPPTGVELGSEVRVRLDAVHPAERRVQFSLVG